MALCTSSYNPLLQFTKHFHEDHGLQNDRLVGNQKVERYTFRSTSKESYIKAASDFEHFSQSYTELAHSSPQASLLLDDRSARISENDGMSGWTSEYKNTFLSSSKSRQKDTRIHTPEPIHNYTPEVARHGQNLSHTLRRPMGDPANTNHFMHSNLIPRSTRSGHQLNPNKIEVVDHLLTTENDFEWNDIFDSLDQAAEEHSQALKESSIGQEPDLADTKEPVIKEKLISIREPLLETQTCEYRFQESNAFSHVLDPFSAGMEVVENEGNLSFAALAFEAACQRDPANFEAWRMLGTVLSEVEREDAAILALQEALKLNGSNSEILMKLAIACTNEGSISAAFDYLEKWIATQYPKIPRPEPELVSGASQSSVVLERIKGIYLEAAQLSVTSGVIDPDVQVGLGVLLFSNRQYQLASDCFAAAIQSTVPGTTNTHSQLHLLWNRYGACMGNMNQYNEANEAYKMALALKPNFVRARYNLALLHQSNDNPVMAAKSALKALTECAIAETEAKAEMMRIVKVGTSHGRLVELMHINEPTNIYETLRKCCGSMCRWDLAESVGPGMDYQAFGKQLAVI